MSDELLDAYPLSYAAVTQQRHPSLGCTVHGQAAVRVLRFLRPVRLDRLTLAPVVYGRWVPDVPTHPAHLQITRLDGATQRWVTLTEVELPPDPRIAGKGLSQTMTSDEMSMRLREALTAPPHVIKLGHIETDSIRVICDREHPVWPNHGECNGPPHQVPFGILNSLEAWGEPLAPPPPLPPYGPTLQMAACNPKPPRGMSVALGEAAVRFESRYLSVGFSLMRPLLVHLGWDAWGEGRAGRNRLLRSLAMTRQGPGGLSGPVIRTIAGDYGPRRWTGSVTVDGNRVSYRALDCGLGITLDAAFTVTSRAIELELTQVSDRDMPVLETEAWRLAWDLELGSTGAAALPLVSPGRNGRVQWPVLWAGDGVGALRWRVVEADPIPQAQVESYRGARSVTGGVVLAPEVTDNDACLTLPGGARRAVLALEVEAPAPGMAEGAAQPGPGLRRHWGSIYACFRPELGGFSNNAASVNCHVNQWAPIEIVAHTAVMADGPNPIALGRFTVGRALLDGGGYGYWRNLYLDSDPILLSAAGRLHQAAPDDTWLHTIAPGVLAATARVMSTLDASGLVVCRDLSGNAGSYRWSSNAMDVVGFGHIDAYVNAWTYRGLRNAAALLRALGRARPETTGLAERCSAAAAALRAAFGPALLNPQTGWIAGWRSRDGALHDYAFTFVNGPALAFGLLDAETARRALEGLEALRHRLGPGSAELGLPCNLLPIDERDHMLPGILGRLQPTFELYTDGSLSGSTAAYYLRALSIYGLREQAQTLAAELDAGFAHDAFTGGMGSGNEFRSWEGLPTGYEGTLVASLGPLYAIAIEQGVIRAMEPEWWPTGG